MKIETKYRPGYLLFFLNDEGTKIESGKVIDIRIDVIGKKNPDPLAGEGGYYEFTTKEIKIEYRCQNSRKWHPEYSVFHTKEELLEALSNSAPLAPEEEEEENPENA